MRKMHNFYRKAFSNIYNPKNQFSTCLRKSCDVPSMKVGRPTMWIVWINGEDGCIVWIGMASDDELKRSKKLIIIVEAEIDITNY